MTSLKSERHHWWPECVSLHWADSKGGVHWLLPDGKTRRSTPNNFGVIGNGHHIKLRNNSGEPSPWDSSFEVEFNNADNNFPRVIDWLSCLERCGPPFERLANARMTPQPVSDDQFQSLVECLVSLAARSPMYREKAAGLAERLRGSLPEHERNSLIGANISRSLRNAVRGIGNSGKILVIYSPEREFIFGDGFYSNLTVQGEHWHNPKMLVPLTPWLSALFVRPTRYSTEPRLTTFVTTADETTALNYAVQVYSKNCIFYKSEKPNVGTEFTDGKHLIFSDHRNSVDELIHKIPGVSPRDASLDFLFER